MSIKGVLVSAVVITFIFLFVFVVSAVLANDVWGIENCDKTQCDECPFPCPEHNID